MRAITEPLILSKGTSITAITELTPELRSRLEASDGSFVISRTGSRSNSVVVDEHGAALLRSFTEPTRIVDAIVACSAKTGAEPDATLATADPLLSRCYEAGWLVPADSAAAGAILASLEAGATFASGRIVRPVQVMDDIELYLMSVSGGHAALKIARKASARSPFSIEVAALTHLAGTCAPTLLEQGLFEGRHYFMMDWCAGEDVDSIAADHRRAATGGRRRATADARQDMLALATNVLRAFATAHESGVIHGDVHVRNILVTVDGAVRLVDFGLARIDKDLNAQRGGVAYFYEPELARAALGSEPWPLASEAGEQYALGALLYFLFTGFHYCDFALKRVPMMRQIADAPPLPFANRGARPWPDVERVLRRALSKNAGERFASVKEFAAALANLQREHISTQRPAPHRIAAELSRLTQEVLQRVEIMGELFASGLSTSPTASVCLGASGIAYGLYRLAVRSGDPALLASADLWNAQALRAMDTPGAFANLKVDITPESVGTVSSLHAAPGLFATQAFIAHAMDDGVRRRRALHDFVEASRAPCDCLDLTLGRASTLLACASLLRIDRENADLPPLGASVDLEIWNRLRSLPSIETSPEVPYLGIAHGWAGLLYASMIWHEMAGTRPPTELEGRLFELEALGEPFGHGMRWPVRPSLLAPTDVNFMSGWCHGTAGYVHLWTTAARVLGAPRYLQLAIAAATHSRRAPPIAGHLCCGAAGQAYAMLALHRHTQDPEWLVHAKDIAQAAPRYDADPGYFTSLYRGAMGVAVLAVDLETPEEAAMPFFEPERW